LAETNNFAQKFRKHCKAIQAKYIYKSLGNLKMLKGVDLNIAKSEIVSVAF
jgi:ABC-type histidine transport system ATPase subunit